jgi:signal transduction histidine kinase
LAFGLALVVISIGLIQRVSVRSFQDEFYTQIRDVFAKPDFSESLADAATVSPQRMSEVIASYAGELGIDDNNRLYYILGGDYGEPLAAMRDLPEKIPVTSNILEAINGSTGTRVSTKNSYLDFAIPVGQYIVYIYDDNRHMQTQTQQSLSIIIQSALLAFLAALVFGAVLSKQIIQPYQKLAKAVGSITSGVYPEPIYLHTNDEADDLAAGFNEMSEHLREVDRNHRDFIANVSHELKTPITNVRSYAETLVDVGEDIDTATRERFLNVVLNESDRMSKMVSDLLILTKMDAGDVDMDFRTFDFTESVKSVFDASSLDAAKRGLKMTLSLGKRPQNINGDPDRIGQVITNIVSNAVRYTPEGGSISITVTTDDRKNQVSALIKDTGIGIPKDEIPKLFERFYRVDKARSRAKGGSGLGLSIAHEIVEKHNGFIDIKSELNEGTAVTVVLPKAG